MRAHSSTVAIVPGTGIVARFGDVVIYLAGETPSTDRLLGAVETVALSTAASAPGAALAQRLAGVVLGGAAAPPPVGGHAPPPPRGGVQFGGAGVAPGDRGGGLFKTVPRFTAAGAGSPKKPPPPRGRGRGASPRF